MLEKLNQSSENILGYKVIGKITKEDYAIVKSDLEDLLQQENSICLLLDLQEFKGEELTARGTKLSFRGEFQKKMVKMAVVGDKKWHEWYLTLDDRLNLTRQIEFFSAGEQEAAWEWLRT